MSVVTRPDSHPDSHLDSTRAAAVPVGSGVLPLIEVVGADQAVPRVVGGPVRYVHLDYAASAPALCAVAAHLTQVLPQYASVHRGAGYLSQVCTALYEQARREVAGFVGAGDDDVVVFTRNTTDALNLLSTAVPGEVVVLDIEHHANLLPWQRSGARILPAAATMETTEAALDAELSRRPAALVTVTGASNVTGEVPALSRLAAIAHAHGARIAVDAAQLLPHRGVDLAALGLDYVAFSGHKLYAPFGAGALVGRRDWLDLAPPHLAGGGAVRAVTTHDATWAASPERHEGGTPNVLGVAALAAACRTLSSVGFDNVRAHEAALHDRLVGGLVERGIAPLRLWPDAADVVGVVSFAVPGHRSALVAAALSAEFGIGVRDGRFCAHPLLVRLGCADGALRASLGVGSSTADVDRLLAALDTLCDEGPRWAYVEDAGCRPAADPRTLPSWWEGPAETIADLDPSAVPAGACTPSTTSPDGGPR